MTDLSGKKVAILVETEYIPEEIKRYRDYFGNLNATVELMTNLQGQEKVTLVSDVTDPVSPVAETLDVDIDIANCNVNDYAIIIVAANYVACRLREIPPLGSLASVDYIKSPPAVRFIASAMANPYIVKGFLCHALWLLTPNPELLKDRKVICHTVILADVHNAGAIYVPDPSHVVVDRDLVTGRSAQDLDAYCKALFVTYRNINNEPLTERRYK